MSIKTKSVTVWALANCNWAMLARGHRHAGKPGPCGVPIPPYHLVSFVYEKDFFAPDIVWARRKSDLEETGVQKEWNLWCAKGSPLLVRPVKVRVSVEYEEKGEKACKI